MTFEQWESLQDEFGFKIIDANYESLTVEKGRQLLDALSNKFEYIFNDDKGEYEDI